MLLKIAVLPRPARDGLEGLQHQPSDGVSGVSAAVVANGAGLGLAMVADHPKPKIIPDLCHMHSGDSSLTAQARRGGEIGREKTLQVIAEAPGYSGLIPARRFRAFFGTYYTLALGRKQLEGRP